MGSRRSRSQAWVCLGLCGVLLFGSTGCGLGNLSFNIYIPLGLTGSSGLLSWPFQVAAQSWGWLAPIVTQATTFLSNQNQATNTDNNANTTGT